MSYQTRYEYYLIINKISSVHGGTRLILTQECGYIIHTSSRVQYLAILVRRYSQCNIQAFNTRNQYFTVSPLLSTGGFVRWPWYVVVPFQYCAQYWIVCTRFWQWPTTFGFNIGLQYILSNRITRAKKFSQHIGPHGPPIHACRHTPGKFQEKSRFKF